MVDNLGLDLLVSTRSILNLPHHQSVRATGSLLQPPGDRLTLLDSESTGAHIGRSSHTDGTDTTEL